MRDIPVVGWIALIVAMVEALQEAFPEVKFVGVAVIIVGAVAKWADVYLRPDDGRGIAGRSKLRRWLG